MDETDVDRRVISGFISLDYLYIKSLAAYLESRGTMQAQYGSK